AASCSICGGSRSRLAITWSPCGSGQRMAGSASVTGVTSRTPASSKIPTRGPAAGSAFTLKRQSRTSFPPLSVFSHALWSRSSCQSKPALRSVQEVHILNDVRQVLVRHLSALARLVDRNIEILGDPGGTSLPQLRDDIVAEQLDRLHHRVVR